MASNNKPMTSKIENSKAFVYNKGTCNLNFQLKVDDSSELRDFKSCLELAIVDIDEVLKGMKN